MKKIRCIFIILLLFIISNIYSQGGIQTTGPSEYVNVSNYCSRYGSALVELVAINCGATFQNRYLIPRKNLSAFKNKLAEFDRIKTEERNKQTEARNQQIRERNRQIAAENARRQREAFLEAQRRKAEAQRKEREERINEIARPAQQNIDDFTNDAINEVHENEARGEELKNRSLITEHKARNQNRNISVTSEMPNGYEMAMMEEEIPCINIGQYEGQDVCKKGDTIIVKANNKKYLLSEQALMRGVTEVYAYTPENAFIISNDLQGGEMPIGYITTTNKKFNSTLYGENERFAKSAVGCRFTEFICDNETYNKFLAFCDWQICKMENSANVNLLISDEIDQKNKEYAELYAIIASQKGKDIAVNIAMDAGDFLWNNKYVKTLKAGSAISILGQNISLKTSVNDYASLLITDALTYPLSSNELKIGGFSFKDIKDCILQSNIIKVKGGDLTLEDLIKDGYRTEQTKKIEAEIETEVAKYFRQGRDIIDKCIPTDLKFKSKQVYLYYAVGKNLIEYGEMLGFMAASIKLSFFDKETVKNYTDFVDRCRKKKAFLEKYKHEYEQKFAITKGNCYEYTKVMYALQLGETNHSLDLDAYMLEEILKQMRNCVFGTKEIPECDILSFKELRPTAKKLQSQQQSNNDKISDNYIAIALLDPDGANGLGHAGLILYDSSKGFLYYSHAPSNSPKLSKGKNYLDCKTVTNEVNKHNNYSEAFYIPISYDTFKNMNGEAARSVNREYKVHALAKDSNMVFSVKEVISLQPIADKVVMGSASNNCLDLLINALEAGGFNNGIIEARSTFDIPVPNIRFNILKTKNAGKQIYINQLCNMIKISYQDNVQTDKPFSIPKRNH